MDSTFERLRLREAVAKTIFCMHTQRALDERSAVLCEVNFTSGRISQLVVTASAWDDTRERALALAKDPVVKSVDVYDGRVLFGRKGNQQ
jgi:hypothetical protein